MNKRDRFDDSTGVEVGEGSGRGVKWGSQGGGVVGWGKTDQIPAHCACICARSVYTEMVKSEEMEHLFSQKVRARRYGSVSLESQRQEIHERKFGAGSLV